MVAGMLSVAAFIIHILTNQDVIMFKKKPVDTTSLILANKGNSLSDEKKQTEFKTDESTVIAKNVCFEGNITSIGHVYIYGVLKGNINTEAGLIKIVSNGMVEGDIKCKKVIIDGELRGDCFSENMEITENGKVSGKITYHTLSIKHGGILSGQADPVLHNNEKNRITDISTEIQSVELQDI
ncbi:polymer-forming cytoskeletal protein [Erwinia psidii]|uniref:Polymer-forming cytoskeletal protein n=2 Tax=Erwinia psidii TaxID=69224 RepID=A0A3N6SL75_9GAMM|nr:polymer-forming cytoskeletal protein [Erwinia psidii]